VLAPTRVLPAGQAGRAAQVVAEPRACEARTLHLIKRCRADLAEAEKRIQTLTETAEGDLAAEPMEPEEGEEGDT